MAWVGREWPGIGVEGRRWVWKAGDGCEGLDMSVGGLRKLWKAWGGCKGPGKSVESLG